MLREFELERIKDQRFYSEDHKCFVTIEGHIITLADRVIDIDKVTILDIETQKIISDLLYESKTKCRLEKRQDHAFGKDVFLLGKNSEGQCIWLEEPRWDCGWYWGFGYLEIYTNHNSPSHSRDIQSHFHFSGLVGEQEYYDHEKGCWRKGEYIHNPYDALSETTFTYNEGWKLAELFAEFYLLQKMADFTHKEKPGCHITTSPVDHGDMKVWHEEINKIMIPKVTAEIMRMLTP